MTTDFTRTAASLCPRTLERAGCRLHYWTAGPPGRPLVVLMHGGMMDHRMFNAQVEGLRGEYRVLVWDARGHGKSQPVGTDFSLETCAQDLLAILDDNHADRAVIGGQSLGGYIAQHVYAMAPHRVRAMVVIGSTPLSKGYRRAEIWALKASLPLFRVWPYKHLSRTIARNTARTEAVRAYALEALSQVDRATFNTIWKAVTVAIDHKGKLRSRIDVPLLLLHGEHDGVGTIRRDMPMWAETEPDAAYDIIPGAGHNANQDNPVFTNRVILEFLRERIG